VELEERFAARVKRALAEPRDETWAKRTEERISAVASAAMPSDAKYHIDSLSCQTAICRLEVTTTSSPQEGDAFGRLVGVQINSPDLDGVRVVPREPLADGSYPLEILIFRRGYNVMADPNE